MKTDHLSDRDILLAIDGEQGSDRALARQHLETCWACRARAKELDNTITEFVRTRSREFSSRIPDPAAPRALFRARLAEASSVAVPTTRFAWPALSAVAAAIAIVAFVAVSGSALKGDAIPKSHLTPGESDRVTVAQLCSGGVPDDNDPAISADLRRQVFEEYGVEHARAGLYEVDYLITPRLGGSKSIRNLWPQPYSARWNSHVKDALEDRMHQMVCQGKLDLGAAQHEIATDWISAYRKYFHAAVPR